MFFTSDFPRSERLSVQQQEDLARQILQCEARTREAVSRIPVAAAELDRKARRTERTRAGEVDRLEHAVDAAWKASHEDPELKPSARAAKQAWHEAEGLRWRLAMSGRPIAHGEARKLAGAFLDEEDLVQEGYIGLLRAAKRFDPNRGIRFATYARWWVRAQMTRAIDHTGRPVRLPGCAVEQTRNLRKAKKAFESEGIPYTLVDLAQEVGIDEERARLLLSQGGTVSLDAPVDDGPKSRTLEQLMSDDDAVNPDEEAIQSQEIAHLMEAFREVLNERQQFVLTMRYGLEDGEFRILAEIGKMMGLSRERVRQIERRALDLLRENARVHQEHAA